MAETIEIEQICLEDEIGPIVDEARKRYLAKIHDREMEMAGIEFGTDSYNERCDVFLAMIEQISYEMWNLEVDNLTDDECALTQLSGSDESIVESGGSPDPDFVEDPSSKSGQYIVSKFESNSGARQGLDQSNHITPPARLGFLRARLLGLVICPPKTRA